MSTKPNNRSEAALRERLEIAGKAVPKGESTLWMVDPAVPRDLCIRDAFNERILTMEDCTATATANHIAANHPDVVRADIEEILRLRAENERLRQENKRLCGELERRDEEISSLERDLDFISLEQYILTEKLFNSRICHKDILCEQEDPKNWKFEGQGGCKNCWDEWARHLASDAIEEAELNAE